MEQIMNKPIIQFPILIMCYTPWFAYKGMDLVACRIIFVRGIETGGWRSPLPFPFCSLIHLHYFIIHKATPRLGFLDVYSFFCWKVLPGQTKWGVLYLSGISLWLIALTSWTPPTQPLHIQKYLWDWLSACAFIYRKY